jgi:hypothetical protein
MDRTGVGRDTNAKKFYHVSRVTGSHDRGITLPN